jgi:hypothetical protein
MEVLSRRSPTLPTQADHRHNLLNWVWVIPAWIMSEAARTFLTNLRGGNSSKLNIKDQFSSYIGIKEIVIISRQQCMVQFIEGHQPNPLVQSSSYRYD